MLSKSLALLTISAAAMWSQTVQPQVVYQNDHFQQTGVAVTKDNRIFVNYPRWSALYSNAVVEHKADGSDQPFPDADWNQWDGKPKDAGTHFVCVQAVVVDQADSLWIVDPAAPMMMSPVPNGPKIVRVDLRTNKVSQVFPIGSDVALPDSYLNDIRVDNSRNFAYLTDSGHGGIVVLDIAQKRAWRKLDGNKSVLGDPSVLVVIKGQSLKEPNGKPTIMNSDSIELSKDGNTLYYKPINSKTLWSVPTAALRSQTGDAASQVKAVASNLFPTDGLWMDAKGRIYLSDVEHNAVRRLKADGSTELIAQSTAMDWPDTFAEDGSGNLYVSASRLDEGPRFHKGYSARGNNPYQIFKLSGVTK